MELLGWDFPSQSASLWLWKLSCVFARFHVLPDCTQFGLPPKSVRIFLAHPKHMRSGGGLQPGLWMICVSVHRGQVMLPE